MHLPFAEIFSSQGEAKLAQDDDLDTAWRCDFGGAQPCVLGVALPESAKVEVIRLYVAAGPKWRDHKGHPRVAKVRVHTDAGYADAEIDDGANHAYVKFSAPIQTQSLAIEVLGVHDGDKDKQVHIAEAEIYGTEGVILNPDPNFFGGRPQYSEKNGDFQDIPIEKLPFGVPNREMRSGVMVADYRIIGVLDMAQAIREGRPHRANGDLALHVLEVLEALERSPVEGRHIRIETVCERPEPVPFGSDEQVFVTRR